MFDVWSWYQVNIFILDPFFLTNAGCTRGAGHLQQQICFLEIKGDKTATALLSLLQ